MKLWENQLRLVRFILSEEGYKEEPAANQSRTAEFSTFFQKKFNVPYLCESNDNLCVNVWLWYAGVKYHGGDYVTLKVSLTAQKHGVWWNFEANPLEFEDFRDNFKLIESNLLKSFESLNNDERFYE